MGKRDWSSNTMISMPVPPSKPTVVDIGGWGYGEGGIHHPIAPSDIEELISNIVVSPGAS